MPLVEASILPRQYVLNSRVERNLQPWFESSLTEGKVLNENHGEGNLKKNLFLEYMSVHRKNNEIRNISLDIRHLQSF